MAVRRPPRPAVALVAAVLLAGLAACASPPRSAPPAAAAAAYVYACPDGTRFGARFLADSVALTLPTRVATLPQVVAASGIRYEAGGIEFWGRGEEAMLTVEGARREGCRGVPADSPWEEARLRGVEFRAVGQEPGWTLEVDRGRALRYAGDYGATRLFAPAPEPERDASGAVTFRADAEGRALIATLRETACQDVMSGERFTHEVVVSLDGAEVRGCGRTLATEELEGTYWGLAGADGAGRDAPHLRLLPGGGRLSSSTGCNTLLGTYEREGERIRFGPVATTRVACLDSVLAARERELLDALAAADGFSVRGDTLTLRSGERTLARFGAEPLR